MDNPKLQKRDCQKANQNGKPGENIKILVVDDEEDVHSITKLVLKDCEFDGKNLELLSAYSGKEAKKLIAENPEIALILLDVVMEDNDSGLRLVEYIREQLKNTSTRIIIRTGQPGMAPEEDIIIKYDINDYKEKIELTHKKFITTLTTALRSYHDIISLESHQKVLEEKVRERTHEIEEKMKEMREMNLELASSKEKLHFAMQAAENASEAKTRFLANMSHEIRTPLNSILGFTQMLLKECKEQGISEKFTQSLKTIKTSGEILSELINNILDLSKIEAGKATVTMDDVNLEHLIEEVFQLNRAKATQDGILFDYDFDPELPKIVCSDRSKLNQILINLVNNAMKFTPKGRGVHMSALREGDSILLQVRDEGIGVPKKYQSVIFDSFEQVDPSTTRSFGGTGLGLNIVKKITKLLGGELKLESEEGKGSVFSAKIPLIESTVEVEDKEEIDWANLCFSRDNQVLLVEDNAQNMEMVRSVFQELGMEIQTACNGKQGIEKALELKPDLILMDMHMPEMDGLEASRQIRLHPDGKEIPIVALSADAFFDQQNDAFQAGASDYLTKPLDFDELIPILEKYLRKT